MKKKHKGLGLNFIAPGVGQFALKRYLRGLLMFGGAVLVLIVGGWLLLAPLVHSVLALLSDERNPVIETASFPRMISILILTAVCFVLIWGWSFLDIIIFRPKEDEVSNDELPKDEAS